MDPYQEFLWRQTMRMDANGATPAQIAEYISSAERNNLRGLIMGEPDTVPEMPGMMRGLSQQVIQGVTFGWGDEALGTLAGMISPRYTRQEGRDLMRAEMQAFRDEHPVLATGANIAGGLASMALPGAAAIGAAGWKGAAGAGAGFGAIAGAGEGEGSLGERKDEALVGAGVGAIAAPLIGAGATRVGETVGALAQRLPEGFKARVSGMIRALPGSPQRAGLETVAEGLDLDGKNPVAVANQIRARADAGMHTTLSEVGGDHTMAVIEAAQEFRTPEMQAFSEKIATRGMRVGDRLLDDLGANLRVGLQNAHRLVTELGRVRVRQASPIYDEVFQQNVNVGAETRRLLSNPLWREIYDEGRKIGLQEEAAGIARGLPIPVLSDGPVPDVLPVRALDYMKKGIDAVSGRLGNDGKPMPRRLARAYRVQLNNVLSEIDAQVPRYGEARGMWQGFSQAIDAVEDGMNDFAKLSPQELREAVAASPEPDFYRIGTMQHLNDVVHGAQSSAKDAERFFGANLFGAEDRTQLQKIQALFDDPQSAREFADRVAGEAVGAHPANRLGTRATPRSSNARDRFAPPGRTRRFLENQGAANPAVREDRARHVANEITRIHALGLDDPYALADLIESIPIYRASSNAAKGAVRATAAATSARATTPER